MWTMSQQNPEFLRNTCVPQKNACAQNMCPTINALCTHDRGCSASFLGKLFGHLFGQPLGSNTRGSNLGPLPDPATLGVLAAAVARPSLGATPAIGAPANPAARATEPKLAALASPAALATRTTLAALADPGNLAVLGSLASLSAVGAHASVAAGPPMAPLSRLED